MPKPGSPQPPRRVLRRLLGVRALMLLILAMCAGLGWVAHRAKVQRDAVAAIRKAGGTVEYDLNWHRVRGPTGDKCLRLGSTRVTSRGLGALENMLGLSSLSMADSHIDDLSPIRHLVRIENLTLGPCPIDDGGLAPIASYKDLDSLYLHETRVTGAGLKRLHGLQSFTVLRLRGSWITDAHLDGLAALPVRTLDLNGTAITAAGLCRLRALPALHRLHLAGTQISDAGLAEFARFPALGELNLSNTSITDAGLLSLASAGRSKRYLHVTTAGTKITEAGVAAVKSVRPSWQIIR